MAMLTERGTTMLEIQYFLCLERGMLPMICLLVVIGCYWECQYFGAEINKVEVQ